MFFAKCRKLFMALAVRAECPRGDAVRQVFQCQRVFVTRPTLIFQRTFPKYLSSQESVSFSASSQRTPCPKTSNGTSFLSSLGVPRSSYIGFCADSSGTILSF